MAEKLQIELITAGVWFVVALASIFLPRWGRLAFLLTLSVAAQVVVYGTGFFAFFIPFAAVFGFASVVARVLPNRAVRWRLSCVAMIGVAILYALTGPEHRLWGELSIRALGRDWPLIQLGMAHTLLLVVFLWEFGARKFDTPGWRTFFLWSLIPPMGGTLIRYTEFDRQLPAVKERTNLGRLVSVGTLWLALLAAMQIAGVWFCLAMSYRPDESVTAHVSEAMFDDDALGVKSLRQRVDVYLTQTGARLADLLGVDSARMALERCLGRSGARLADLLLWGPWSFYLGMAGMNKIYRVWGLSWNLAVPVNYNYPFFRRNIGEFWQNWNMTAASIFRDLFFYNRWGFARPNVYLNLLILFLAMGAWHDLNAYWVLFGLLHGIGFCCYTWFRGFNQRRQGKFTIPGRPGFVISATITYLFVCGCWALPPVIIRVCGLQ